MRVFKVKVNGKSYDVEVDEINGAPVASAPQVQAAPVPVQPVEPAPAPIAAPIAVSASTGGTPLNAPLPGLILALKVADGATVKKGQVVLELEAMKMGNDIPSPADGVITFAVAKGANVNTGDLLATVK